MSTDKTISRRGLLMKMGILFTVLVVTALAVPIVRFLLSSVTRGRANRYLSWVSLGAVSQFPEGETRLATFRNPYVTPTDGKTADTACWVRRIGGEQFQVFAIIAHISAARALVPAVRAVHVALSRRCVLPRWVTRLRPAGAWIVRVSAQNTGRAWSRSKLVSYPRPERAQPFSERTAMRLIAQIGEWF